MPGPVSDSFDREWGTESNRADIDEARSGVPVKNQAGGPHLGPPALATAP